MGTLLDLSALELRDAIASGRASAAEAARAAIEAATARRDLNAFLQLFEDAALDRAREIDRQRSAGEPLGPLAGVPVALKDNICLDHGRTTCGSRYLEHYESPFSATAARRLIEAGAVIIGKTNMDEFAMGSSTENSAFGPTRSAWDPARVPGGSSGGSASAVAASVVPIALGSDTGGSIRQPAAFSGLVGVKPSYGRVSRWGLVAHASSLDQIGPFARTVADAALALEVIAGPDDLDSTCARCAVPSISEALDEPFEGLRVGVVREARGNPANTPAMREAYERVILELARAGAEIIELDLPHLRYGIAAYYLVATAEASSNLARFDGVRYGRRAAIDPRSGEALFDLYARSRAEGLGPEVQRRIMLGTYALSSGYYDAYYLTALKVRRLIQRDFAAAFDRCHAVLMPTTPGPAFKLGEKTSDPLAMYLEDLYTVTANLAGVPAMSVPAGYAPEPSAPRGKLPLGVQVLCPMFEEARMLRIGRMIERLGLAG